MAVELQPVVNIRTDIPNTPELRLSGADLDDRVYFAVKRARCAGIAIDIRVLDQSPIARNLSTDILKVFEEHDPFLDPLQLRERFKDPIHNYGARHPGEGLRFHIAVRVRVIPEHPGWVVCRIVNLLEIRGGTRLDINKDVIAVVLGRDIGPVMMQVSRKVEGIDDRNVRRVPRLYPQRRWYVKAIIQYGLHPLAGDVHFCFCGCEGRSERPTGTAKHRWIG